ncbi:hypothetical protein ACLOJK_041956 [Asimina triloba]
MVLGKGRSMVAVSWVDGSDCLDEDGEDAVAGRLWQTGVRSRAHCLDGPDLIRRWAMGMDAVEPGWRWGGAGLDGSIVELLAEFGRLMDAGGGGSCYGRCLPSDLLLERDDGKMGFGIVDDAEGACCWLGR